MNSKNHEDTKNTKKHKQTLVTFCLRSSKILT